MSESPRIVVTPPGPKAKEALRRDKALISSSVTRVCPLVVETGRGCTVTDVDGNRYIDFNSGIGVMNVGHCHPRVIDAIKKQAEKLLHYSYADFYYEIVVDLASALTEITPGSFEKMVFFSNSGAESIEAGIKVAKWHTRKHRFLAFIGAFHGRTIGALSFTASKPSHRKYFFPLLPGVTHVPFPYCYRCPFRQKYPECEYWCVDFIEDFVLKKYVPPEEVSAILFEPIQGEGGYIVPPLGYFERLKKLADKYNILLVDDEVQSGMGRTGRWFAIEHWGIEPDVTCIAKALASGLPLGATVAKADVMDWEPGSHASTFGGNPLSCAAALAVIKIIEEEKLLENATKQGDYILKRLREMQGKHALIGDVRGKGLMIGMEIVGGESRKEHGVREAKEIVVRSFKKGVALLPCGSSTVRIFPPLTITRELIDKGLEIIEDAIGEVEKEVPI